MIDVPCRNSALEWHVAAAVAVGKLRFRRCSYREIVEQGCWKSEIRYYFDTNPLCCRLECFPIRHLSRKQMDDALNEKGMVFVSRPNMGGNDVRLIG